MGASPPPIALESFDEGAVLLHLWSGACFRLNPTAADICRKLAGGHSTEAIAHDLSRRFGIDLDQARSDVEATLAALDEAPPRRPIEEPLRYEVADEAHFVLVREKPVLRVEPAPALVRLASEGVTQAEIADAVDGVTPKLLALRGMLVLHASAVAKADEVRAFLGPSGAGKTTTARALVEAGWGLVAEDVVVLRGPHPQADGGSAPCPSPSQERGLAAHVVLDAEARARAWAKAAKETLVREPASTVDFACLDALAEGPVLPLSMAVFLDERRRRGGTIELEPLDGPDALVALFGNAFVASAEPAAWETTLRTLARLARAVRAYRATMPEGVEALATAARGWA